MAKAAKAQHQADMTDLNERVGASFEEQAARRAWNQQVAHDQQKQTAEKMTAMLLDYKESHTGIEYWPFEASKPGMVLPDKKVRAHANARATHTNLRQKKRHVSPACAPTTRASSRAAA